MSHLHSKGKSNPIDYYLVVDTKTNMIYESFRLRKTADNFLLEQPLNEDLKVIINPKYENERI